MKKMKNIIGILFIITIAIVFSSNTVVQCKVVKPKVIKVQIIAPSSMYIDSTMKASVKVTMSKKNAKIPKITYRSNNSKVVAIDANGNIRAVGIGRAVISAITNNFTAKTSITVKPMKAWLLAHPR